MESHTSVEESKRLDNQQKRLQQAKISQRSTKVTAQKVSGETKTKKRSQRWWLWDPLSLINLIQEARICTKWTHRQINATHSCGNNLVQHLITSTSNLFLGQTILKVSPAVWASCGPVKSVVKISCHYGQEKSSWIHGGSGRRQVIQRKRRLMGSSPPKAAIAALKERAGIPRKPSRDEQQLCTETC